MLNAKSTLAFVLILGGAFPPKMYDSLYPRPTHRWDFQTAGVEASQRGGTTATFVRAEATSRIVGDLYTAVSGDTVAITEVLTANVGGERQLPTNVVRGYRSQADAKTPNHYVLLRNTAIDNAAWSNIGTPVVTADVTGDIYNVTTVDQVEDDDAGVAEGRSQAVTIPDNTNTWTTSVWVGCVTPHTAGLELTIGVNTTLLLATCGNLEKWTVATANPGGVTTATVKLWPAGTTASAVNTTLYSYAQLYQSEFERLDEPLVGAAAVGISEETLEYSSLAPNTNASATWCAWVWFMELPTGAVEIPVLGWGDALGGVTPDWTLSVDADGDFKVLVDTTGGDAAVETIESVTASTWAHVCMAWTDGTDLELYLNGALSTYSTHDETWTAGANYGTVTGFFLDPRTQAPIGTSVMSRAKMWSSRSLNASQVRSLYNRERGKYGL